MIAAGGALLVIAQRNPIYSVLALILSFFGLSGLYVLLEAPFVAVVQIIIYAGAIMVLFVFVIMILNLGKAAAEQERRWLQLQVWIGPAILAGILLAELIWLLVVHGGAVATGAEVPPKAVGIALFGPYVLAVELASMLLLGALVGALHLGKKQDQRERQQRKQERRRAEAGHG